jgi:SAM-dependent methyltransferase
MRWQVVRTPLACQRSAADMVTLVGNSARCISSFPASGRSSVRGPPVTELGRFYQDIFEQHHDAAWDRAPGKDVLIHALRSFRGHRAGATPPALVDVGCGTGFLLDRISREVETRFELHGIDFAPLAIARGQKRYPDLQLRCGDGTATGFASGRFEALVSYGAMEHFPDPAAAIVEAARILAPGGWFLIMLPTLGAYRTDRSDEGWYEDLTGQPQWNLTRASWEGHFAAAQLKLWHASSALDHGARQPAVYFFGEKPRAT